MSSSFRQGPKPSWIATLSVTETKPVVLVVTQEEELADFIAEQLSEGFQLFPAQDGDAALAFMQRNYADIVLVDASIGLSNKFDIFHHMSENRERGEPPVVILMANYDECELFCDNKYRPNDLLLKPILPIDLFLKVDGQFRARQCRRDLEKTRAHLSLIMDNAPAGIILLKPIAGDRDDFLIEAVNFNINKIAGLDRQYLFVGQSLAECLRPAAEDGMYRTPQIDARISERMAWYASQPDDTIWSIFSTVNGRFVRTTRSPHSDYGFVVVTVDTTDQVNTERALAEKSEQFDLILENMPEGIALLAPDLTVLACNSQLNMVLGVDENCIKIGRRLDESLRSLAQSGLFPDDNVKLDDRISARIEWYKANPERSVSMVSPISGNRYIKIIRSKIGPYGMVVIYVNITEHIRAEENLKKERDRAEGALESLLATQNQLIQSEKLASLGRLVAGVAHEINTPLGVAVTVSSLFSSQLEQLAASFGAGQLRKSEMTDFISESREACELVGSNLRRAVDLVQSFRHVAADQVSDECRSFELGAWLREIVVSLGPIWRRPGHRIDIECLDVINVQVYPGVISQVITNLVTNSVAHGFDGCQGGVIKITATISNDGIIILTYCDNGKGIPLDIRDKIFDPFFTTRRHSGSSGLGMYIIYNLVVGRLGGSIDICEDASSGVCFIIRFPREIEPFLSTHN